MAYFEYKALRASGEEIQGGLDAESSEQAAANLREQGLFVVQISEGRRQAAGQSVSRRRWVYRASWILPVMARDRAMFFRQLAMMVQTGLTLLQALAVCGRESNKRSFRKVVNGVSDGVQGGASFSSSLRMYPRVFSPVVVQMIESAEASGNLDVTMRRIADRIEQRSEQLVKLVSALFYPVFVMLVAVLVTLLLVYGVIPKFATFIENRGGTLPASTQFLMDFSRGAVKYLPVVLFLIGTLVILFVLAYRSTLGRMRIHRMLLDVPVIGGALTYASMSQFGFTLANLLESGLTLIDSLRIAGGAVGNDAIKQRVIDARERIVAGETFSSTMDDIVIPPTVSQVIAIGEQTGDLGHVMDEIGEYYDDRLQARIRWLSAITEPVLIVVIGTIVGFVYFSFFMAVINMTTAGR